MIKVVKIGGNVVDNPSLLREFVRDFAAMPGMKVLVHGGGVMASQMQKEMGMVPKMVEGRRVTDEETLKVVTMVYAGWCNKNIVALLQAEGCNAIGLTGADGNAIKASRRPPVHVDSIGEDVDYGYVGDVTADSVNAGFIYSLLEKGIVPVFNAINHDGEGNLLNTNADTIASSVAIAMAKYMYLSPCEVCSRCEEYETDLIYCFEKDGVLYDKQQTILFIYPTAKAAMTKPIPDTVHTIEKNAFLTTPGNGTGSIVFTQHPLARGIYQISLYSNKPGLGKSCFSLHGTVRHNRRLALFGNPVIASPSPSDKIFSTA